MTPPARSAPDQRVTLDDMELIETLRECLADRYDIERELGGGGMSRVFVAAERALARRVVIKVLSPELGQAVNAERFRLEIATSATLQHPQIVPVYSTGACGDLLYYVMPFVAGESLRAHLDRIGTLPPDEVTRILVLLARGLAYAHRENVVHRDIKPENILLAQGEPMLADFGIAKVIRQGNNTTGLTSTGMSIGTVTYMAPEQVVADPSIDGRADVYSLAALGFELLSGAPPFTGTPQQVMSAHVVSPVPDIGARVQHVPPTLAAAITAGLAKDALARPTASEFATLLSSQSVVSQASSPSRTATRRTPTIGAAVAVLVLAGIGVAALRNREAPRADEAIATPSAAATQTGLAVLPFENIGGAGDDAWFAAGLTAELTTAIGKVDGIRIASRSTVRAFADSNLAPIALGQRLGVKAMVEGSAQRIGDRLRVTARLIDAADGHALWSESYDRTVSDVFATQSEISAAIVAALAPRFGTTTRATTSDVGTQDATAYDDFLRARFAQEERDLGSALTLFRKAAARDTLFARAYAGIAEVTALRPVYGDGTHVALAPEILSAAARALALDSTLAEPHTALGLLAKGRADWAAAERELRLAAVLQPTNGTAAQTLAELLFTLGRFDEAAVEMARAARVEPMNGLILGEHAYTLMLTGRIDSARATAVRALLLDGQNPFILYTRGVIEERAGAYSAAVQPMAAAVTRAPQPFFLGALAR
ncbi:MAG: protein kinase, partial [Gemmatimonadaceae bacterium]|nr:protein kinase [Gemmatimonadaceae bacterium]